jgi:putative Holliday junction resolvase
MRIMALDIGDKRIGVAVTDEGCSIAQGVGVIRRRSFGQDVSAIKAYIAKYSVSKLVVGIPYRGDGIIGGQTRKVIEFLERIRVPLTEAFPGLEIEGWDESLTTMEAGQVLSLAGVSPKRRREVIDKLAAVFILESYLRGQE